MRYQLRYFPIEWCKDTGIFFIGEIYTLLFYDDVNDVLRLSGIVGDEQNATATFEIIAVVVYGDFQLLALAGFKYALLDRGFQTGVVNLQRLDFKVAESLVGQCDVGLHFLLSAHRTKV